MQTDALTEPLFTTLTGRISLPGLLAALSRGEPIVLTHLRAHQQHPMHAFCVQLAAIALIRAKLSQPPVSEEEWRSLLVKCAAADGAGPEAFNLVVTDLSKPALLQPPVPEKKLDTLKNVHTTPSEEMDVLIASKNHDVKLVQVSDPTPEDWFFGLLCLQTFQGFLGAGNYGVARMNGGFGTRCCVAFAPSPDAGARFLRDVRVLLDTREGLLDQFGFAARGVGLLWCPPWDGTTSYGLSDLDPFFIEVCRRVRLADDQGRIVAHRGSSKAPRILASEQLGNIGDPWIPIARPLEKTTKGKAPKKRVATKDEAKALTLSESGFHYGLVAELLFSGPQWAPGAAGRYRTGDRFWLGQALVRGQGKTGGYHERWVPIPNRQISFLEVPTKRDALAARAGHLVVRARDVRLKVLKPALLAFLQGGPDSIKFDAGGTDTFLDEFEREVDAGFFEKMFEAADLDDAEAIAHFDEFLFHMAERTLQRAIVSAPTASARRHRAIARATSLLFAAAHKVLPNRQKRMASQTSVSTTR